MQTRLRVELSLVQSLARTNNFLTFQCVPLNTSQAKARLQDTEKLLNPYVAWGPDREKSLGLCLVSVSHTEWAESDCTEFRSDTVTPTLYVLLLLGQEKRQPLMLRVETAAEL